DAVRAILDGHVVMERAIAERGRYPAINILRSVSRTMPRAADPAYLPIINQARQVMATYADMEELIRLGAYRPGSSAEGDEAIRVHGQVEDSRAKARKEAPGWGKGYQRLEKIWGGAKTKKYRCPATLCDGPGYPAQAGACQRARETAHVGAAASGSTRCNGA